MSSYQIQVNHYTLPQENYIITITPFLLMESIEEAIEKLPIHLKQEALDFIQFLIAKHNISERKTLSFKWAGGLKKYKDRFTSLALQKKGLEWWGG